MERVINSEQICPTSPNKIRKSENLRIQMMKKLINSKSEDQAEPVPKETGLAAKRKCAETEKRLISQTKVKKRRNDGYVLWKATFFSITKKGEETYIRKWCPYSDANVTESCMGKMREPISQNIGEETYILWRPDSKIQGMDSYEKSCTGEMIKPVSQNINKKKNTEDETENILDHVLICKKRRTEETREVSSIEH